MSVPHINRDSTVKLLEGLKVLKMKRVAELRSSEITAALEEVVAKVNFTVNFFLGGEYS